MKDRFSEYCLSVLVLNRFRWRLQSHSSGVGSGSVIIEFWQVHHSYLVVILVKIRRSIPENGLSPSVSIIWVLHGCKPKAASFIPIQIRPHWKQQEIEVPVE